jgi:ubiquinone/menaquinone biosynthesis C-methylase UbiE
MTDAKSFNDIASNVFAPAYPAIAAQIVGETGISNGICLDIGCGGGHLGFAMAGRGSFDILSLDPSDEMLAQATRNAAAAGLSKRVRIVKGSAEAIPLPDASVDLAVSRGSIFFWNDLVRAFQEIHRVLKPSGVAYVGGGFGSAAIRNAIIAKMKERDGGRDTFVESMRKRSGPDFVPRLRQALEASGVPGFRIEQSPDKGLWAIFKKETASVPQQV